MKLAKSYQIAILGLIISGYVFFRFWNLTSSCLFFDELFSVQAAKYPLSEMFWFVAQDLIHPPLSYLLLKIWIIIGGESLIWLKLFPVSFSIIAVAPFYFLCKELKLNFGAISVALVFFAVNGCLIKYAQEVRMYSLLLCFGLFSVWLFVRLLNQKRGLIWLILINILLVNTHYFGWLIIFSELISALVLGREQIKNVILMFGATILSFVPWIYQLWQALQTNADYKQNLGWAERPNITTIYHFVNDLFEPFYFQQTNADRPETIFITAPIILICVISTLFFFLNWKTETEKNRIILLLIFIKTPIIIAFIASWVFPVSVWGTRHLIIVFPLVMIYFAITLTKYLESPEKIISISK